jgi:type I restriction enzyme R subunit
LKWVAIEWDEEGGVPDRVDAAAINEWLFNEDTVDKVLVQKMPVRKV